jgi:hypothetical protein
MKTIHMTLEVTMKMNQNILVKDKNGKTITEERSNLER